MKLFDNSAFELRSVYLKKGEQLKPHTSPKEAVLLVLSGKIGFHSEEESFHLEPHQILNFPKEMIHWVEAFENSEFLLIR